MDKLAWLSHLIAFDTTSRHSNLDLIHFIMNFLQNSGINTQLIYDETKVKANLFAIIPAHHGVQEGGLILSGHTDVVPVDGQQWEFNPFQATQRDNQIFGRGTCDMKGFIAVVLALVPEFLKLKLSRPIYLAFSYDEEIGCLGVPSIINYLCEKNLKPAACLVGEPTNMQLVVAHKGRQTFRCSVQGKAAHSSLTPQGCNSIEYAAKLICFIRDLAQKYQEQGPFDNHYDVPYTTLTTNLINGGNAQNTIPACCEFIFEFRHLSHHDADHIHQQIHFYVNNEILPKMRSQYSDANIILQRISDAPGLNMSEEDGFTILTRKISQLDDIVKVAYATEAGLYQAADIPTIICGPGSIEQAHRANEYVTLEQLDKCETFITKLVHEFACQDKSGMPMLS